MHAHTATKLLKLNDIQDAIHNCVKASGAEGIQTLSSQVSIQSVLVRCLAGSLCDALKVADRLSSDATWGQLTCSRLDQAMSVAAPAFTPKATTATR